MRAFLLSVIVAIGLAFAGGLLMGGKLTRSADRAFATESARVGYGGSVAARQFSGEEPPRAY